MNITTVPLLLLSGIWPLVSPAATFPLETADLSTMSTGWGKPQRNLSTTERPLRIGGKQFNKGIGTHAPSDFILQLDGRATRFTAQVGVDDNATNPQVASVEFHVFSEGRELWKSGVCKPGEAPRSCSVDLTGMKMLELVVTDAGNGSDSDHANWAEPAITFDGGVPLPGPPPAPKEEFTILTPPAPKEPRINGPRARASPPCAPARP